MAFFAPRIRSNKAILCRLYSFMPYRENGRKQQMNKSHYPLKLSITVKTPFPRYSIVSTGALLQCDSGMSPKGAKEGCRTDVLIHRTSDAQKTELGLWLKRKIWWRELSLWPSSSPGEDVRSVPSVWEDYHPSAMPAASQDVLFPHTTMYPSC